LPLPGTRNMRLAEPKREAAIVLFRLPTRGLPAVKLKFSSSPVPCVQLQLFLFPLSFDSTRKSIPYCHALQSVNPHLLLHHCRRVLWSHSFIVPFAMCLIIIRPSCPLFRALFVFSFPIPPRTMTLASSAFHWPNHGDSLVFVCRRSVFTPKYIIAFLASRARLRVGDVIKVRCHRNQPGSILSASLAPTPMNVNEPLITPVIALAWHPPVGTTPGSSLTLLVRRTYAI
jgi:hypothetical protein